MNYNEQRAYALKLFKGKKYKKLREAIKAGECFNVLSPLAKESGAIEYWDKFIPEWLYWAGRYWEGITDEMRREAWSRLEGEWLYRAGRYWKGITDEMRRKRQ